MKHLLFAIGLVATLASCSKKEEPAPEPTLMGRWKLVDTKILVTPANGQPAFYSGVVLHDSTFVTFKPDGHYTVEYSQISASLYDIYDCTYTTSGYITSVVDVHGTTLYRTYTTPTLTAKNLVTNCISAAPGYDSYNTTSTYVRR